MADNNLTTSISALITQIKLEIPNANAENLKRLARSVRKLGYSGDNEIDTLINNRANALTATATTDELQTIAEAINQVDDTLNPTGATNVNADVHVSDTAPASAVSGDIWFNSTSLNLYVYYDDGDSQQWLDLAGQATTVQVTASDTAPTSPSTGQLWFDTANLNLFVYYSDGSSNQWVQMNSEATAVPTDISDLTDNTGLLSGGGGNEAYDNFGTSTSYNPGTSVAHGSYIKNEANTADVAASVTVTSGFSKIKVELDASIANITDATTEMLIALERTVDGLNPTTVKMFLFPAANSFYGSQHFLYIDTHGASAGSTVEYKLKVDMSSFSNESARVQWGICGDTLYIKEIV